jgi:hypothetical protein
MLTICKSQKAEATKKKQQVSSENVDPFQPRKIPFSVLTQRSFLHDYHHNDTTTRSAETDDKRIGFCLVKSDDKTWRKGLEDRFRDHMASLESFHDWIPFSLRVAQLASKKKTTSAIMLYVWKSM